MHAQRGGFVDGHHHRLAHESATEKVPDDVLRHGLQAVVARQNLVLVAQFPFELRLLFSVEVRFFNDVVNVVVQIRIGELQLRRAILIEQRHRRAIGDGLLEVVNRDVVAKHLTGALFTGDQRRTSKGQEQRLGRSA